MFPAIKELYFWTKEKLSLNLLIKIKMYYCIIWIIITIFDGSTTMPQVSLEKVVIKFLRERMDFDNIIIIIISQSYYQDRSLLSFQLLQKKDKNNIYSCYGNLYLNIFTLSLMFYI